MAALNIGDLVVTTLRNRADFISDNISKNNSWWTYLKRKGKIKKASGGRVLTEPLLYGSNSSVQFYDNYDTFTPPTTQEIIDAAEFNWKQLGGFVSISGKERFMNRGEAQVFEFVEVRIKQLMAQLSNTLGSSLFSDGTGSGGKELGGLKLLIADDPTAAGTVGGISQSANTFWRNQYSSAAATDKNNIQSRMNAMWLSCIRGADKPDLILADSVMYTAYWESLQSLQRFTSADEAQAGFMTLMYQDSAVLYDYNCPAKRMYFLDEESIFLRCAPDRIFEVADKRTVTTADYDVVPVWFAGNLVCNRRAGNGVIIAS